MKEKLIKALGNSPEVQTFAAYVEKLQTEKNRDGTPKNKWAAYLKVADLVRLYKQVQSRGLTIDGDTVTLQFKGELTVSYNYQAYKNLVLTAYPETKFDLQNVYEGDTFSFRKESGKVIYEHVIGNPFDTNRKWIGCYCVIKNSRGEFLETMNEKEIEEVKAVAKTKNIWNDWFGEMALKSVIKRACKRHFKDVVVDDLDNENYELDKKEKETVVIGTNLFEKLRAKLGEVPIETMREHYVIGEEVYKAMQKMNEK